MSNSGFRFYRFSSGVRGSRGWGSERRNWRVYLRGTCVDRCEGFQFCFNSRENFFFVVVDGNKLGVRKSHKYVVSALKGKVLQGPSFSHGTSSR